MISSTFSRGRSQSSSTKGAEQSNTTNPLDDSTQAAEDSHQSSEGWKIGSETLSSNVDETDVSARSKTESRSSLSTDLFSRDTMPHQYSIASLSKLLNNLVEESHTAWSIASSVLQTGDNMTIVLNRTQEVGLCSSVVLVVCA
ncbi:hypothetical protein EON64_11995 [archaeon]|nr:MAG: hypothetical protein EON64_11995 [archaeon]